MNWFSSTRRLAGTAGVALLLLLGFVQEGSGADRIGYMALAVLVLASVAACAEVVATPRASHKTGGLIGATPGWPGAWMIAALLVAAGSVLAVQTWFGATDTSIAGGDIPPPDGVAWLGRLFAPWVWSGSDLGSPGALEPQLPWAVVAGLVHFAGGPAQLAQRIWYTAVFGGSALGALLFLKTLGSRPLPAAIGAAVYVFNPYVLTINVNPVYLLALALAAVLPTCVLAAARSQISIRTAAILIGICAPLLGYVYENPPLAGMLLALVFASPLLAWLLWGGKASRRALLATILGLVFILLASGYWIIPALIQVHSSAIGNLAALSSWSWTEVRATIRNAFWLNTTWAWNSQYFPFAPDYSVPPLSILKFILPAAAFGALVVTDRRSQQADPQSPRLGLRIVAAASVVSLFVIVLSTGTRPPGNWIFGPLYSSPFGWLLREPGRFLLLAGLGYAVLVAALVDRLTSAALVGRLSVRFQRLQLGPAAAILLGGAISLGPGFPLAVGAVVPDARPPLPSTHVRLPGYWVDMGAFTDGAPYDGPVMVLPPDDFYQMPYRWGYYGNDSFIANLMHRRVLVPNPQGYFQTSAVVMNAVDLTASSLLRGDWEEADRLLNSLGAPLILVRGDINSDFPGRAILAPTAINAALERSPDFTLIQRAGPLALYARHSSIPPRLAITHALATVDSSRPDLRELSLLPSGSDLVSAPAIPGVIRLSQVAPLSSWDMGPGELQVRLMEPAGWGYKVGLMSPGQPPHVVDPIEESNALNPFIAVATEEQAGIQRSLTVRLPLGKSLITDGAFQDGAWQAAVGDCNEAGGVPAALDARVIGDGPNGLPALRLSGWSDSACEARDTSWNGGSLLVHLWIRHVSGAGPRLCMFEIGPNRCAPYSNEVTGPGWGAYTVGVRPDADTKAISLFLYADADPSGGRTVNDYADVAVYSVPSTDLVLVGYPNDPVNAATPEMLVLRESYSDSWAGPARSRHVLVDGMTNGWLIVPTGSDLSVTYAPTVLVSLGSWLSCGAFVFIVMLAITPWPLKKIWIKPRRNRGA